MASDTILTPVSPGEVLDKITILEIKAERITDPEKLKNVRYELSILAEVKASHIPQSDELDEHFGKLKKTNQALWDIEDDIRICEKNNDFGESFVSLARSVYMTNDVRAAIKKDINQLLGSHIVEEKSYEEYA